MQPSALPILLGLRRKHSVHANSPRVILGETELIQPVLYGWIDHIYHVGSSVDCKSIIVGALIAGGKVEVKVDEHASSQQWTQRKDQ